MEKPSTAACPQPSTFSCPQSKGRRRLSWIVLAVLLIGGYVLAARMTRIQSEAIQSQERFNRSIQGSQAGSWEWVGPSEVLKPDSYVWYSDQVGDLLGYDKNEIQYTMGWFLEKVHPSDLDAVKDAVAKSIHNRVPYKISYRLRCKDGRYLWFSVRGVPFYDQRGVAAYMSGTVQDIHPQMLAAMRLQRLVDSAPVAMVLCNAAGLVTEFNAEATKMFGYSRSEMIGCSVDKIIADKDLAAHKKGMEARVEEYSKLDYNWSKTKFTTGTGKRKDGTEFPCNITMRSYKYEGILEFVAIINDKNVALKYE